MIKQNKNLTETKDKVKSFFNKEVEVKVNLGRNKFAYYQGRITSVYPALFTITPTGEYKGKTAFSYSEYMCGVVDIKEVNS